MVNHAAISLAAVKRTIRQPYAWPGGYPLFAIMDDGGALCVKCLKSEFALIARSTIQSHNHSWPVDGWSVHGIDTNWEDPALYCDNCNKRIESAYAEDDAAENLRPYRDVSDNLPPQP